MLFVLWSFWLLNSHSAFGEKLVYHSPKPQYELERTNQGLSLKTPIQHLKIAASGCNQTYLQQFWTSAVKEFERHPITRGSPNGAFVDLDGKRRLLLPNLGGVPLANLPERFLGLMTLDRQKCSK